MVGRLKVAFAIAFFGALVLLVAVWVYVVDDVP
jgi:hypothetical protein